MLSNPPRQARAAATRQHLLEVAASTFAERGYAATSMSELVHRSGVTRGAFYFHFDSKAELALAAFRMKQQEFIDQLMVRLGTPPPGQRATDLLLSALRVRAELLQGDPAFGCMRRLCTELRSDPGLGLHMAVFHTVPVSLFAGVIRQAQAEGDVRPDVPAERLARLIFAATVGVDELSQTFPADELVNDLIDVLARGLSVPTDG